MTRRLTRHDFIRPRPVRSDPPYGRRPVAKTDAELADRIEAELSARPAADLDEVGQVTGHVVEFPEAMAGPVIVEPMGRMAEAVSFPPRAVLTVVDGPVLIPESSAEPAAIIEPQGPPPPARVPEPPAPPRPRAPSVKIDLRNAPSSMEQRAESWRGKA